MLSQDHSRAETAETLRQLRRRIYALAATAGLAAVIIAWVFKTGSGTATAFDQVIFPVLLVAMAALLFSLWRIPAALGWVELALYAGMALSLLARLAELLFTPPPASDPQRLAAFTDLLYWFPMVYVLAVLIFNSRRRLIIGSLAFFLAVLALGLTHHLQAWLAHGDTSDLYLLTRFYAANLAYFVLLFASMSMNERYVRLHTLAETEALRARTDALVQIANRRELDEVIARVLSPAFKRRHPVSVIMFDLDRFKQVNDTFGHAAGDAVLKAVADIARGQLRQTDVFGRWGGEEFLIILPSTDSTRACEAAERLRQAIGSGPLAGDIRITASFGVAEYQAPETAEAWLKRADAALYAAKTGGRNRTAAASITPA